MHSIMLMRAASLVQVLQYFLQVASFIAVVIAFSCKLQLLQVATFIFYRIVVIGV